MRILPLAAITFLALVLLSTVGMACWWHGYHCGRIAEQDENTARMLWLQERKHQ